MNAKILICFVLMVCLTVAANILMKQGSIDATKIDSILDYKILLGLTCFGLATFLYLFLIRWLPLNVIQAFGAVQFILIIVAASFILDEPITSTRWIGMSFIAFGIAIVGWTYANS